MLPGLLIHIRETQPGFRLEVSICGFLLGQADQQRIRFGKLLQLNQQLRPPQGTHPGFGLIRVCLDQGPGTQSGDQMPYELLAHDPPPQGVQLGLFGEGCTESLQSLSPGAGTRIL